MSVLDVFSMAGKSGFITGAARGIGKKLADAFLDAGANVAIADIDIDEAQKTADNFSKKYNKDVPALRCDVTDAKDAERMVQKVVDAFGPICFAVNNAGIFTPENAMEIEPEQFKKVIDVNLNGVFFTAQAAARMMKKSKIKGSIISTASMSGHIVNRPQTIANYCAAKAGVIMLTKCLAVEWADLGIRVNSVSPGYMKTELIACMDDMIKIWEPMIPMGRMGVPDDLVGIYLYLASDASKYATGADYVVDGGYICP
jgi:NAD(P)-dependent dehydrogenase (short-subunit alcohol dehydrogenase family)